MSIHIVDLSNNNKAENPDFKVLKSHKFDGVYFKLSEGTKFEDHVSEEWAPRAIRAGLMVGFYHFFRGAAMAEGDFFSHLLAKERLRASKHFRPCLDFEVGTPSGLAAHTFNQEVHRNLGVIPLFYSYADFAARCAYQGKPVGSGLWLAGYGRNDGREHPFAIPKPWRSVVGHQYTSKGRTPGINGLVDMSIITRPAAVEVK